MEKEQVNKTRRVIRYPKEKTLGKKTLNFDKLNKMHSFFKNQASMGPER